MGYKRSLQRMGSGAFLLFAGSVTSMGVLGGALGAWPTHAFAGQLLSGAALESPVGRFFLGETTQGLDLMAKILGRETSSSDVDEFLGRFRDMHPSEASQLEARISEIRQELLEAQRQRSGTSDMSEPDSFTNEEQSILRQVAAQNLKVGSEWHAPDPQAGEIQFTDEESEDSLSANRSEFLAPTNENAITLKETPGEKAPEEIKQEAKRGLRQWYTDSQACLQNRPTAQSASAEWKYLAQQWLISGSTSAVSYIVETGVSHFDLAGFGIDLLMSLVSQGVAMKWMGSKDSFQVLWLKYYTWGQARTVLDAEVYRISPWTDTRGVPMDQAVSKRRNDNFSWNAKTSWVSPVLYTVLNGIDCLLDEQKGLAAVKRASHFKKAAFLIRAGASVGNNILYYKLTPH